MNNTLMKFMEFLDNKIFFSLLSKFESTCLLCVLLSFFSALLAYMIIQEYNDKISAN